MYPEEDPQHEATQLLNSNAFPSNFEEVDDHQLPSQGFMDTRITAMKDEGRRTHDHEDYLDVPPQYERRPQSQEQVLPDRTRQQALSDQSSSHQRHYKNNPNLSLNLNEQKMVGSQGQKPKQDIFKNNKQDSVDIDNFLN